MVNGMKKIVALVLFIGVSSVIAADCVDCGMKDVEGMPGSKSFTSLEKVITAAKDGPGQDDYISKYCLKFTQTPKNLVGSLIKEFENSPYPADEYFLHSKCQMDGQSLSVKSPMIHCIAETPDSWAEFLNNIWLYYSKKRKQPEIFKQIINMQNTRGETILDYIETLRLKGRNVTEGMKGPVDNLIAFVCSHGGVYNFHKNKSCAN